MNTKKYLFHGLRITFLILMVFLVIKQINWIELQSITTNIHIGYLSTYPILWLFILFVSSLKTKLILDYNQVEVSIIDSFKVNYIGLFSNNFIPGGLGSDTMKYLYFKNKYNESSQLIASLIVDKIIGLLSLILFSIIFGSILLKKILGENFLTYYIMLISLFLLFVFSLTLLPKYVHNLKKLIQWKWTNSIIESFGQLGQFNFSIIFKIFSCHFVILALTILAYRLLFQALKSEVEFFILWQTVPLIFIGEYIPLSVNSIGIREEISILLFGIFGISTAIVLANTIISRGFGILLSSFGGLIYLFEKKAKHEP